MTLWLVRAGKHGEREQVALDKNEAVIGFDKWGDFREYKTKESLKEAWMTRKPDSTSNQAGSYVGQIWQFVHEINKGDLVVLPLKTQRSIAIGRIEGDYEFRKDDVDKHVRKVEWISTLPRSLFDQNILYSFGSFRTIAKISRNNAEAKVQALLQGKRPKETSTVPTTPEKVEEDELDIEEAAKDQLTKYIDEHFKGHELARLVDAVLRAQGFTTHVSKPGPDGGVDILAATGSMGLDSPHICVQVKSASSQLDSKVLRELVGVIDKFKAEKGILVSWGGFNSGCLQEAKDAFFKIRLWDQGKLIDNIIKNYEKFDDDLKAELPLKRIWTLVSEEENE